MDPKRAKSIFLHAVEQVSPSEWPSYLDEACGNDTSLRHGVELLLAAHEENVDLAEQARRACNSALPTIDQPPLEKTGTQIGPYKLLQEIGQGGMGVVYMAEQHEPVRRKVALKIIKPGMDTRQVIARFEAERQALSLMDHPNIARVLDAGTTDSGRPYFVMELVKGQPITEYCNEQHLTPLQRLELFLTACHAIQHAHQKGIIHRDVKPSNVLVAEYDGRPVAKVIDFGVAKAVSQPLTEKTMFTGYGQIVGTLEYMSPEQARVNQLDIDTRSDIYSLGVLLYELLTGSTPFDKQRLRSAAWDEMLRIIREEEPPKPSTRLSESKDSLPSISAQRQTEPAKLTKLVRGELDWIVMKALEKDRGRRYETANGLASDIQRYLNDEPVAACPPSAAYRFRKFARRNNAALVTAGLVAATLVAGLVGTAWQAIRATVAERRAQANEQLALDERDQKEAAWREALASAEQARAAAESERQAKKAEADQRKLAEASEKQAAEEAAVAKAVNEFLQQDLLGLAGANAQLDAKLEPDPNLKLATLLFRALAKVDERFADQPRVRAEVQATLASALHSIGRHEEAARLWEQVRQHYEATLGAEHPTTLWAMNSLAALYRSQARHAEAEPLLNQCLEIRRRVLGPEHPNTLTTMNSLAVLYEDQARYAESEPLLTQCLESQRRILGPEHTDTLMTMNNLAGLYRSQARHAEAEALWTQCLESQRRVRGPEHSDTLTTMNNLAMLYKAQGKFAAAEPLSTHCLEILRRVHGPEHPHTLVATCNLANLYEGRAQYAAAEPLYTQCLEIQRRVRGSEHPDTLTTMNNLAMLYKAQGKFAAAEPLSTQCLEIWRRVRGPEHPDTLTAMNNLAALYEAQTRHAEAEPLYTQCLEIKRRVQGPEHPGTLTTMSKLAELYKAQGEFAEAEPLYTQCLEILRRVQGPEHPHTFTAMNNLAKLYLAQARYAEAEPLLTQCLEIQRRKLSADDPRLANTLLVLGHSLTRLGRSPEAEPLLRDGLAIREKKSPDGWPPFSAKSVLGECLSTQGKHEEAEQLLIDGYQGLKARAATLPVPRQRRLQEALQRLIAHYESEARGDEAARWRAELEQLPATPAEQNTTPARTPVPPEEPGKAKD